MLSAGGATEKTVLAHKGTCPSTLHFTVLQGHVTVVRLLLDEGMKTVG